MATPPDLFAAEFLSNYLKFGLGSMPKADVDALVMALLDRYGDGASGPMAALSNQAVSERLRTPVTKVKRLRYDAALKFSAAVEEEAKGRLLAALASATFEPQDEKICLIIEDSLAKNWLQGQLKSQQRIFDHPFSSEIIRVSSDGLFKALGNIFESKHIEAFRAGYETVRKEKNQARQVEFFKALARKFAEGAAQAAGSGVVTILKAHFAVP